MWIFRTKEWHNKVYVHGAHSGCCVSQRDNGRKVQEQKNNYETITIIQLRDDGDLDKMTLERVETRDDSLVILNQYLKNSYTS